MRRPLVKQTACSKSSITFRRKSLCNTPANQTDGGWWGVHRLDSVFGSEIIDFRATTSVGRNPLVMILLVYPKGGAWPSDKRQTSHEKSKRILAQQSCWFTKGNGKLRLKSGLIAPPAIRQLKRKGSPC